MTDFISNTSNINFDEKDSIRILKKMLKQCKNKTKGIDYENLFKYYLRKETNLTSDEISLEIDNISSLGIFEDLEKTQDENNSQLSSEEELSELERFNEVLNVLFEEEEILNQLDVNQDGELDDEEKMTFLTSISSMDGKGDDLSMEDLVLTAKELMNGKTLEEVILMAEANSILDSEDATLDELKEASESSKLSSPNTHASNYTEPDGTLKSKETEVTTQNSIEEIDKQIEAKNNEKLQLKAQETKYTQMISDLKAINEKVSASESKIESYNSELHSITFDLETVKAQLANMSEPVIFTEYKDEYEQQKASLEAQQQTLEASQKEIQAKIDAEQKNLDILKTQKSSKEEEISAYESEHPDNEITQINEDIKDLEQQKQNLQDELKEQREQEISDAEIYGKSKAHRESELVKFMMDYATDPATKEKYDKWYYEEFNGKAYCAVFSSDVVKIMYAKAAEKMGIDESKLQEFYENADKTCPKNRGVGSLLFASSVAGTAAWGNEMQTALNDAGIDVQATVDITSMTAEERKNAVRDGKIYPGMTFTYMENGRLHIGFVESLNADLSWNTIEGNTFVRYEDGSSESNTVGSHRRDTSFADLSTVTDSTVKVMLWMKYMGYSDEQIENLMY